MPPAIAACWWEPGVTKFRSHLNGSAPVPETAPEPVAGAAVPAPLATAPPLPPSTARMTITAPKVRQLTAAKSFTIAGTLVDLGGTPISGAMVSIQTRSFFPKPAVADGLWSAAGTATTDAKGRFQALIPAGSSRTVLVSYAAPGVSDAVAQADFTAPASITVRAKRTHLRNGTSAVFRGQVGGPIPNAGVPVFLEVREPTRWIPVATTQRRIRTSPSGNFTLSYKFLRTFQPARYRFRIIADEDSAFPYRRGTSPSITIYVRP